MWHLVGRDDDGEEVAHRRRAQRRGDDVRMSGRRHRDRVLPAMRRTASSTPSMSGGRPPRNARRRRSTTSRRISSVRHVQGEPFTHRARPPREFAPITAARSSAVQVRPCDAANSRRASSHQISESTRTPSRSNRTASKRRRMDPPCSGCRRGYRLRTTTGPRSNDICPTRTTTPRVIMVLGHLARGRR